MTMTGKTFLMWLVCLVTPLVGLAEGVQPAQRVPFVVPLADGQSGTAMMLDATQLILAAPGQPPRLALFQVTPLGPSPSPEPQPHPIPNPEPPPPVPPRPGFLDLLWIEETAARTPQQARAITDRAIRDSLAAAGWSLRVVDQDITDETGKTPPELVPAIAAAKRAGLPYLIVRSRDGAEVYAGKAPADVDAFKTLLKRLGLVTDGPRDNPATPAEATDPPQTPPAGEKSDCPSGQCPSGTRTFLFRRR
jgi:hypothetical protein